MDLKAFSKANLARCISKEGFNHTLESWSFAEWTNAIGGELGEAQNLTKKLLRHRDNIAGNLKEIDKDPVSLKRRAAEELGDAMAYIDLAIQNLGEDTEEILRFIWNRKSEEIGYKERI